MLKAGRARTCSKRDTSVFSMAVTSFYMHMHESPVLYSVDLHDCEGLAALSSEEMIAMFGAALERAGATVVQTSSHTFPGAGLTSVLILRESHAVLHTWPETGTVNIDIFSCSTRLKSLEAVSELSRYLGARQVSVQETPRADGHSPARPSQRRA
jgi:S-adenosylmethionine decarboxylase